MNEINITYKLKEHDKQIEIFGSEFIKIIKIIVKLSMKIRNIN